MKEFFKLSIVAIAAMVFGQVYHADAAGRGKRWQPSGFACADQDLSGGPTCSSIETDEADFLVVKIDLTRDGAATDVTMTCELSDDNSDWYPHPGCTNATSPTIDCDDATWQKDGISADDKIAFFVPLFDEYIQCSFAGTASTSDDTITVTKTLGTNN